MPRILTLAWLLVAMISMPSILDAQEAADASAFPASGSTSLKYRIRWIDEENDQDLFSTLNLNLGNERKNNLSISGAGRGSWDLDGNQDNDGYYAFDSVADTFDHRLNGQISHLYANLRGYNLLQSLKVDRFRIGRQYSEDGEVQHFDGARVDSLPFASLKDLQFALYGGIPVHLYESSTQGDSLIGVGLSATPVAKLRMRLDWQRVEDDSRYNGDEDSDLTMVSAAYPLCANVGLDGRLSVLEEEVRDSLLRAVVNMPEKELFANLSIFSQYKIMKDYATEFDPFYAALKTYYPYYQMNVHVTKGCAALWNPLTLGAGVVVREIVEDDKVGQFNQEFRRYYLKPTLADWPITGVEIGLTGELWNTSDDDITSFGFDIAHQCTTKLRASTGTYYSLYKYDEYGDREREDVRTIFLRAEYDLLAKAVGFAEYEYEKDDFDGFHTFEVGVKYRF